MSYTPTTWAAGDTVTAAKLNKLEQGVASSGGGVLVVGTTMSDNRLICNKTCKEMWDAMKTGGVLVDGTTLVYTIVYAENDDGYTFVTYDNVTFAGDNDNDNPWALLEG